MAFRFLVLFTTRHGFRLLQRCTVVVAAVAVAAVHLTVLRYIPSFTVKMHSCLKLDALFSI